MTWRSPPLWIRWVLAVVMFAGAGIAFVAINRSGPGGAANGSAAQEAISESRAVVARDQAPHAVPLERAAAPRLALERVIAVEMRARIRRNELAGPLQRSKCTPLGVGRPNRRGFRCKVQAGGVGYPFLGVVDLRARRITWCKRDPPPTPALDVPVSPRCRP